MVHGFAKLLEILPDDRLKDTPKRSIDDLKAEHILPKKEDFLQLKKLFIIHCLRIICKRIPELNQLENHINKHVKHRYSEDLKHASVTVSK